MTTKTTTPNEPAADGPEDGFLRCYVLTAISQDGERIEAGEVVDISASGFQRLAGFGAVCLLSEHEMHHAAEVQAQAALNKASAMIAKARAAAEAAGVFAKAEAADKARMSKGPAEAARSAADKAARRASTDAAHAKAAAQEAEELAGTRLRRRGPWTQGAA